MKKVLLFGTGEGAQKYLLKYGNNIEIIAVFDNDVKKHENLFCEKYPIYSPLKIKEFNYDEIIIVSQWAKEIYNQLINDLKIEKSKIVIPKKSDIKTATRPFEDENTMKFAREIIKKLMYFAMEDNICLVVDFGTLLGLVRDNDVIEWDDDVDFSIINLSQDFDFSSWIKLTIEKMQMPIKLKIKHITIGNKRISYSIKFDECSDIKQFSISMSFREIKDHYSIHLPSNGLWYAPKEHFERHEIIVWQGCKIQVPYNYKEYLSFLYGDWQTPKKDISMNDYANLGYTNYEEFEKLRLEHKELL